MCLCQVIYQPSCVATQAKSAWEWHCFSLQAATSSTAALFPSCSNSRLVYRLFTVSLRLLFFHLSDAMSPRASGCAATCTCRKRATSLFLGSRRGRCTASGSGQWTRPEKDGRPRRRSQYSPPTHWSTPGQWVRVEHRVPHLCRIQAHYSGIFDRSVFFYVCMNSRRSRSREHYVCWLGLHVKGVTATVWSECSPALLSRDCGISLISLANMQHKVFPLCPRRLTKWEIKPLSNLTHLSSETSFAVQLPLKRCACYVTWQNFHGGYFSPMFYWRAQGLCKHCGSDVHLMFLHHMRPVMFVCPHTLVPFQRGHSIAPVARWPKSIGSLLVALSHNQNLQNKLYEVWMRQKVNPQPVTSKDFLKYLFPLGSMRYIHQWQTITHAARWIKSSAEKQPPESLFVIYESFPL